MFTMLDLLVIVFMVLTAASLLTSCLMFLVRNEKVQKVCFYITAALGIYVNTIGIRIASSLILFPTQLFFGILLGLVGIGALVLGIRSKGNQKHFMIARIATVVVLVAGILNAFL